MKNCLLIYILLFALNCLADDGSYLSEKSWISEQTENVRSPQHLYHGSPYNFNKAVPYHSTRIQNGQVVWEGEAIFATEDYRIALFYTHNKENKNYLAGVDLITRISPEMPLTYTLVGGSSVEEALDYLFGKEDYSNSSLGYIYLLPASAFHWEDGLGAMEQICDDSVATCDQICINRRAEIQKWIECGLIKIDWRPNLITCEL